MKNKHELTLETPRVENGKPLLIVGLRGHFTAENWAGIPAQWQRFAAYLGKIPGQKGRIAYGLCFPAPKGIDYLSGIEVSSLEDLPQEFAHASIPAQRYAVFPHREHVSKLRQTVEAIWSKWLPESGLEAAPAPDGAPDFFERYGEGFDPKSGMGDIEVWVPIAASRQRDRSENRVAS